MAKKTEEKEDIKINPEVSKNLLGALLNGNKDKHFNFDKVPPTIIPSGSLIIDSCVTVKTGTTIRMGGPAEVGKTSQALLFADNYMKTMPKSKAIYVNAESKLSEELLGRTGMKFVYTNDEWDYGTVFVYETNVFDAVCNTLAPILKTAYEQGEHVAIIIDSVDMLTLASSQTNPIGEGKRPAGVNYLTKEMFRIIAPQIRAYNALLIMITQYSAVFSLDPYAKKVPQMMEGNNTHALNHQSSCALYYRPRTKSNYIMENPDPKKAPDLKDNKILGLYATIDVRKSATDNTGYTIEVPIIKGRIGSAIWVEKEVADLVLAYELALSKVAWITFDANIIKEAAKSGVEIKEKINGINQLYEYLSDNKAVLNWLKGKVESITKLRLQIAEA